MFDTPLLREPSDTRTLAAVALYFATTAAAFAAPSSPMHELAALAACCWLSMTGAIVTHNLAHVPVFRSAPLNQAFQIAVSLTYGHPVSSFVPGHNLSHHRFTQTRKDYMRTSKVDYRWNLANLLLFMPTVAGPIMRSDIAYTKRRFRKGRGFFWRFLSEVLAVQAANLALLWVSPRRFLLFWLLPHLWAQYAIVAINFMQHDGCEETRDCEVRPSEPREAERIHINGARNFTGGLLNALLFNNGYHTIHHLHPHLHWSRLPEMHAKLVAPRIDPRLNEPNFAVYFWRTFLATTARTTFRGQPLVVDPASRHDEPWMAEGCG
jgi:fatty acid desaturase